MGVRTWLSELLGYHTIKDADGAEYPQRGVLKLIGASIFDNSSTQETEVTFEGGGGEDVEIPIPSWELIREHESGETALAGGATLNWDFNMSTLQPNQAAVVYWILCAYDVSNAPSGNTVTTMNSGCIMCYRDDSGDLQCDGDPGGDVTSFQLAAGSAGSGLITYTSPPITVHDNDTLRMSLVAGTHAVAIFRRDKTQYVPVCSQPVGPVESGDEGEA